MTRGRQGCFYEQIIVHHGLATYDSEQMHSTGWALWHWAADGEFQPTHGPNGGVADWLDAAKAAFRAAWERQRPLRNRGAAVMCSA